MVSEMLQSVEWSRAQFALTAIYHWLFVPLTLGLSVLCALMETRYYRTGDPFWRSTTKFWMRLFGINFAIGVATGLILEFEFGTNWSNYSNFVGDIFGAPLAIEGIMAFFLESTFVAVMFFGWDKVSRGFHLSATWLTAIGANLSALWILVANSWMQYPVGCSFNIATVRNEMDSFWDVLFSPVAINKFSHTVTSSFLLAAIFVMGVSAWYLLRGRHRRMARSSIALASVFGLVFALVAAFSGDRSGAIVARVQPMKLAAMEALYDGEEGAPLTVVGLLRPEGQRTCDDDAFYFKIGIPQAPLADEFPARPTPSCRGSTIWFTATRSGASSPRPRKCRADAMRSTSWAAITKRAKRATKPLMHEVERLFDASTPEGAAFLRDYYAYFGYGYLRSPQETVPNVPLVFYSFRVMVGAGCFFGLLCAVVWWLNRRDRLAGKRWLLRVMILSIPLAYLASQAGWIVAEVGRQPWTIQNLLPACVSGSHIAATPVAVTFFIFLALFTVLLAAELAIMLRQIKIGPNE